MYHHDSKEAYSLLIALTDNYTVGAILGSHEMDDNDWGVGTFADPSKCVQITLEKGEAILFSGRLVHCGGPGRQVETAAGFQTSMSLGTVGFSDLGFHCYLDVTPNKDPKNSTLDTSQVFGSALCTD